MSAAHHQSTSLLASLPLAWRHRQNVKIPPFWKWISFFFPRGARRKLWKARPSVGACNDMGPMECTHTHTHKAYDWLPCETWRCCVNKRCSASSITYADGNMCKFYQAHLAFSKGNAPGLYPPSPAIRPTHPSITSSTIPPSRTHTHTHLLSSLYHSNSGLGTAEASHWRTPMRPTWGSELLASLMKGGSEAGKEHRGIIH